MVEVFNPQEFDRSEQQVQNAIHLYNSLRDKDEAVKIGLYGDDLDRFTTDSETTFVELSGSDSEDSVFVPLLVPAEKLEWYNIDLLKRTYGTNTKFYYYTHPPIPEDLESKMSIRDNLKKILDSGAVIFFDQYNSSGEEGPDIFNNLGADYKMDILGGGDQHRTAETFIGPVKIDGIDDIKIAPSLYDVYQTALENGELEANAENGVSLAPSIEGDDALRLWEIYENPFDELGEEHPAVTGFGKEGFMEILKDPEVVKIINRVDGKISTLCIFVQDFDHCPWFNKKYFQENYSEYFNTNNILMFPGIVSDEQMRGNNYSLKLIDLATRLLAERKSNFLVTFECTETSAQYIPNIVTAAVSNSGVATIQDLERPVSVTEYKAIKKEVS